MNRIPDVTPGEILSEEFLVPMSITAYRLAKDTNMPATRISEILKGRRRITADTALRLSAYFGNSAEFWLGIQDEYDLRLERTKIQEDLKKIPRAIAS
jgi:addiction module HigA family antidote